MESVEWPLSRDSGAPPGRRCSAVAESLKMIPESGRGDGPEEEESRLFHFQCP